MKKVLLPLFVPCLHCKSGTTVAHLGNIRQRPDEEIVSHGHVEVHWGEEFFMPKKASELIKQCEIFTIEDEVDHHAQHELNTTLHFPKGQSLSNAMSAERLQESKRYFSERIRY